MENTLTKLEILNETIQYYSEDTDRRAMEDNDNGTCKYTTTNGKHCAVGRCFTTEFKLVGEDLFGGKLVHNIPDLDDKLEPKYRGHEVYFWRELQRLHDDDANWGNNKLSNSGEFVVNTIKTKFNITE